MAVETEQVTMRVLQISTAGKVISLQTSQYTTEKMGIKECDHNVIHDTNNIQSSWL